MKAVMAPVPPEILALHRRTGADRYDEMWEGVLHMVAAPNREHQDLKPRCLRLPAGSARGRPQSRLVGTQTWPMRMPSSSISSCWLETLSEAARSCTCWRWPAAWA